MIPRLLVDRVPLHPVCAAGIDLADLTGVGAAGELHNVTGLEAVAGIEPRPVRPLD